MTKTSNELRAKWFAAMHAASEDRWAGPVEECRVAAVRTAWTEYKAVWDKEQKP